MEASGRGNAETVPLGYVSMGSYWEKFNPVIKEMRARKIAPRMDKDMEFYYNKWKKI